MLNSVCTIFHKMVFCFQGIRSQKLAYLLISEYFYVQRGYIEMVKVQYKSINVQHILNSSGIFFGDNIQYSWQVQKKTSAGFGQVKGNGNKINKNSTVTLNK